MVIQNCMINNCGIYCSHDKYARFFYSQVYSHDIYNIIYTYEAMSYFLILQIGL